MKDRKPEEPIEYRYLNLNTRKECASQEELYKQICSGPHELRTHLMNGWVLVTGRAIKR